MKYALIGCGRIAPNHIKAVMENRLELTAVCDLIPERMEKILDLYTPGAASVKRYTDYRKMIEEVRPELVAVATESGSHAEVALFCIEHGINVIIEKPIAMSIADADRIIRAGKKHDVVVCANHQNRFNLSIQAVRKALEAGRFGKLSHGSIHVRWNRDTAYYEQAPWRGTWAQDGGALMNQCIHGIDLLRWMLGDEVDEVYGVTRQQFHHYLECEDLGMAVVKFKNGAVGTIEGTTNVYPRNLEESLFLFGETGTVKVGGLCVNNIDVWNFADCQEDCGEQAIREAAANVYGNGHSALYADVLRAIVTHTAPYVTAEAGKRALELVLAIYKSSHEGRPVKLPLETCSTLDFIGEYNQR